MPRANRYFLSGHIWHLTQRCHNRDFLLRFAADRRRWRYWLLHSRLRYGLCVLNYTVTSNHIHLLVRDNGEGEIAAAMQLMAGRTAQEFNQRKGRVGAYWQGRYHATAVDSDAHLARCIAYIDLNMVRAGVVTHPRDWLDGGYHELFEQRRRNRITDVKALEDLLNVRGHRDLLRYRDELVTQALATGNVSRDPRWTQSKAVGSEAYVRAIHAELRIRSPGLQPDRDPSGYWLKEPHVRYTHGHSAPKMASISRSGRC
jgi:putative transposase